jgi:hypothetical protein
LSDRQLVGRNQINQDSSGRRGFLECGARPAEALVGALIGPLIPTIRFQHIALLDIF